MVARWRWLRPALVAVLISACSGPAATRKSDVVDDVAPSATPLSQRSIEVTKLFSKQPGGFETYFAPSFLTAVPPAQIGAVFADFHQRLGPCTGVEVDGQPSADGFSAKYTLSFDEFTVPLSLTVDPVAPHLIVGLWLGNPVPRTDGLTAITRELSELPGKVSFRVVRLPEQGGDEDVLAEWNPDVPLAIGSAFKLYVFSELVRSVKQGERDWEDVVRLDSEALSLPSGQLHTWPPGAPLTLHSLAALMISQSDNTATDQLLRVLGRERVEAMMPVTGHQSPSRNRPFLTTAELFKLKGEPTGEVSRTYLSSGEAERRKFLETAVARIPRSGLRPLVRPQQIDSLEWFASSADLCRLMAWIHRETSGSDGEAARQILSINPGLGSATSAFRYVGFKGGSEPGVLNLTFLLQTSDGSHYAVAASWNDPAASLDERRFFALIERALLQVPGTGAK